MSKWVALFSQTGSEIANLAKALGRWPDEIFTNNNNTDQWHPDIVRSRDARIKVMSHNGIQETISHWSEIYNMTITMHGYLRILDENICNLPCDIYNGHPAPIDLYPELKGKDPQKRIWQSINNYPIIGSVVHRVIAGVDEGKIVKSVHYTNRCSTEEELFEKLRQASLEAWTFFMKEKLD